jgi:adenylate cyclase
VRDRLDYPFEDSGEQQVKNIARAMRVYRLRADWFAKSPSSNAPALIPQSPALPRLSIVVLPFDNPVK